MKKFVLLVLALGAFSVASFAGTVSEQCLYPGSVTTAQYSNAVGGPSTASCGSATSLGIDGVVNVLTSITIYVDADYQNCGNFTTPCTSADVKVTFTPSTGTWSAVIGALSGSSAYEDVTGASSSNAYSVNGVLTALTSAGFTAAEVDNTSPFYTAFSVNTSSALASVAPTGLAPVTSSSQVGVTFAYTTVSTGTPEPVSMILFGSGLLGLSLIGRKKLARK